MDVGNEQDLLFPSEVAYHLLTFDSPLLTHDRPCGLQECIECSVSVAYVQLASV